MRRQFNPSLLGRSFASTARRLQVQPAAAALAEAPRVTPAPLVSEALQKSTSSMLPRKLRGSSRRWTQPQVDLGLFSKQIAESSSLWLRDSCTCPLCVDSSTKQKNFQTSDIPLDIAAEVVGCNGEEMEVTWKNDMPGFPASHKSVYSTKALLGCKSLGHNAVLSSGGMTKSERPVFWDKSMMEKKIKFLDYEHYLSSDYQLWVLLRELQSYGLVFLRGVPNSQNAVELIAKRIGNLRDTFYGRTWDVKSVPQAKNVAYTNVFLGFHMDLLYMTDPPGIQLLHCLKNTCEGGSSMFSDSFRAVHEMVNIDDKKNIFKTNLTQRRQVFHYKNAGEYYRYERPMLVREPNQGWDDFKFVNWSPPFQGPFPEIPRNRYLEPWMKTAKAFQERVEAPESIYEYKMQEGDCVLFNNRRILHARRAFDTASGERWLKGAYLDTDVFHSRYRVLRERFGLPKPSKVAEGTKSD